MRLPPDARDLPPWVLVAVDFLYDDLHYDLWSWSIEERTHVLLAALDYEKQGRHIMEAAIERAAIEVLKQRNRMTGRRRNK